MFASDRDRAARSWARQVQIERQLFDADRAILQAQLQAEATARRGTQFRVMLEMLGILLVGVGTWLS